MLGRLKHPGIVKLLDHGVTVREGRRELLLLTEWGKGGNLLRFLDAISLAAFTSSHLETIYKHCIAQIVQIVDDLQTMGVSHRDLKVIHFLSRLKISSSTIVVLSSSSISASLSTSPGNLTLRRNGGTWEQSSTFLQR
jgi:serine/threonine protein kinase